MKKKSSLPKERHICICGCGRAFLSSKMGRPRHYFSDSCRAMASQERRRLVPEERALAVNVAPIWTPPPLPEPPPAPGPQPREARGATSSTSAAAPRSVTLHTQTTGATKNFGRAAAQTVIYVQEETLREQTTRRTSYTRPQGEEVPRG